MNVIRNFSKEFMLEVLSEDIEGARVIEDNITHHGRWSVSRRLVFEYEDKFWRTSYRIGATESQDESPWDYQSEIECFEVEPVAKTVLVYEKVEKNA